MLLMKEWNGMEWNVMVVESWGVSFYRDGICLRWLFVCVRWWVVFVWVILVVFKSGYEFVEYDLWVVEFCLEILMCYCKGVCKFD